jgi:1,4-dihydroxy-2-naphthoate octaprenyltransferase
MNDTLETQLDSSLPSLPKRWFKALRAYSAPASLVPLAIGITAPIGAGESITWWTVPLVVLVGVLIHIGTNLINDAVDFEKGVDRKGALGGSGVIVDGWLSSKQIRNAALFAFGLAGLIGIPVMLLRGWPLLLIGVIGVLGGYFYTAPPVSLKYRAFGDLAVFILCGPLLVAGVSLAVSGRIPLVSLLAGIPVGCVVTAILVANNLRDIQDDGEKQIKTLAMLLGVKGTQVEYVALMVLAFLSLPVLAILGFLPYMACITLVALPLSIGPVRDLLKGNVAKQVVERTAQFHLVFGVLLTVGLVF